jgi:hypothetical protein
MFHPPPDFEHKAHIGALYFAQGSLTHLTLSEQVGLLDPASIFEICPQSGKKFSKLQESNQRN